MTTIKSLMNLEGRKVLITGAAGGLGRIISETLAELGADLILVDLPESGLEELCDEIKSRWVTNIQTYSCNLESQESRLELLKEVISKNNNLNCLVNNAAFVGSSALDGWATSFEKQSIETWRRAIEVNLTSVFELCQGLSPLLKASVGSNIINIASIYGEHGPDWSLYENTNLGNPAAYGVSKGGLIQLTRWLATTLSPEIRVNALSPGGIFRAQPQEFILKYEKRTPLKRMATENDFKGAIAFLSSDMSSYVTGQIIGVDGGWGVW